MDRRVFIKTAGALSLAAAGGELILAAERCVRSDRAVHPDLQRALMSGAVTSRNPDRGLFGPHRPLRSSRPRIPLGSRAQPDALAAARALDAERKANKLRGPLHGIPIIVKDNIETARPGGDDGGILGSCALPAAGRRAPRGASAHGGRHRFGQGQFERVGEFPFDPLLQRLERYRRPDPQRLRPRPQPLRLERRLCRGRSRELLRRGHRDRDQRVDSLAVLVEWSGRIEADRGGGQRQGRGARFRRARTPRGPCAGRSSDAAVLAAAIAERPLGYGAHGNDLEAFRLRGVRIGAMPVPEGAHPDTARLFADARTALAREGAVIIDLKSPSAFGELEEPEFEALLYEFKAAINDYLATLDQSQVGVKSLADLIAFNAAHANEELVVFGQEIFEMAEARGPLTDAVYQKASRLCSGPPIPKVSQRSSGSRGPRCCWRPATGRRN